MLRQDLPVVQFRTREGIRIEVGASILFLAIIMVHMSGGIVGFLHDLAIFVLILFAFYLREVTRSWVVSNQGHDIFSVSFGGAGGQIAHSRASIEEQEVIAAMGPLTSLGLWAISALILPFLPEASAAAVWLEIFAFINLYIGIITALPVLPLDGGRFLFLYLGRTVSPTAARRVVGGLGLLLSVIWLPAMLLSFLVFGILLLAVPSMREHWGMLKGDSRVGI